MNRKKFLKASIATLSLGLIFPSLIRGKEPGKVITTSTKDSLSISGDVSVINEYTANTPCDIRKYPLTPDECFMPSKEEAERVLKYWDEKS